MGVKGLQAFMEQQCNSIRKVSLVEMIQKFKKQNPGIEEPILVIDGHNCMYELYSGFDWICSGQWIEFVEALQNFVQSLQNLGLKLVFFFDGCTPITKREEWYKRRMQYVNDTRKIYDCLKTKCHVPQSLFRLPASMGTLIRFALKYDCKVPVYTVINGDCDQVVATFAKQNNCLAILTQDSDYVIYDTVPFISIQRLNLRTLETVVYDRDIFCAGMNLTIAQLPLLACLMGNDYVPRDSLNHFHARIIPKAQTGQRMSYNSRIILGIIQFITSVSRMKGKAQDLNNHLPEICQSVFGSKSQLNDLRNGLLMYNLCYSRCDLYRNPFHSQPSAENDLSTPKKMFDYILEKSINTELSETMYHTITAGTCEFGPSLEDEGNKSFAPEVLIYRPIRSRLYDLILNFKNKHIDAEDVLRRTGMSPSSKDYIEELWVTSSRPHSEPDQVPRSPLRVNGEIPDLDRMWTDNGKSSEQLKWETIKMCFNLSQSIKCLKEIPDKFKLLCMMLNYLIQCKDMLLESWEVDAFLVQCVLPNAFVIDWVKHLKVTPYDPRAVHLAALFYRGTTQFYSVLSICGEPYPIERSMPWHFFDGKRFHHCYTALKCGTSVKTLCSNDTKSLDQFQLLKTSTYEKS